MGTRFRIIVYSRDESTARTAFRAAFKRVHELEQVMSDYDPRSEVMQLCVKNDANPGQPISISDDLLKILELSLKTSKLSDGAFDITIGPLSQLWRQTRKQQKLPSQEVLDAARSRVGYELLELNVAKKTLTLKKAGMRLDFGGIGKGHAADESMAVLKQHGIESALVAASGDITVSQPPPGRDYWIVEIPAVGKGEAARWIQLANASVSTSGDLFQYVEIEGTRYSHLLDPKTGLGLTGRRSATVIASTGALADSLTKAASIMPVEKALAVIDHLPGAALYLVVKETDKADPKTTVSSRFKDYELKKKR